MIRIVIVILLYPILILYDRSIFRQFLEPGADRVDERRMLREMLLQT